jgi:hypothetical protein
MIRSFYLMVGLALVSFPVLATPETEARDMLSKAQAEESAAREAKCAWVPTETALTKAQKAVDGKQWKEAKEAAEEALTLARLSIKQANEQKSLWQNAVIR